MIYTWSGLTAFYPGKARWRGPIYALTPHQQVADRLALAWGVTPVVIAKHTNLEEMIYTGEQVLLERKDVELGEEIVILAGSSPSVGSANLMKIHEAGADN